MAGGAHRDEVVQAGALDEEVEQCQRVPWLHVIEEARQLGGGGAERKHDAAGRTRALQRMHARHKRLAVCEHSLPGERALAALRALTPHRVLRDVREVLVRHPRVHLRQQAADLPALVRGPPPLAVRRGVRERVRDRPAGARVWRVPAPLLPLCAVDEVGEGKRGAAGEARRAAAERVLGEMPHDLRIADVEQRGAVDRLLHQHRVPPPSRALHSNGAHREPRTPCGSQPL